MSICKNKVLAPFLSDLYGTCLDRNEIRSISMNKALIFIFMNGDFH